LVFRDAELRGVWLPLSSRKYDIQLNKYKVKAGQDQAFWESKGWIHEQDPRGWFHWYCRF
jgi:hypothetical protein